MNDNLLLEHISYLRNAKLDTDFGMPQELFLLLSGLIPIVNVDLLIVNSKKQILLVKRKDAWYQNSWHIPGGCMHYGEDFMHCVQETAKRELGTMLKVEPEPITVKNVIRGVDNTKEYPRERGHNVAVLFKCIMPDTWNIDNGDLTENDNGYMAWFNKLPDDFMEIQHVYDNVLQSWIV